MKTQLLNLTVFLLLLCAFASSCNPEIMPENYPIDILYKEYSLEGTSCQWQNLPYNDKVIIINNNEELEKYIEGNYPTVDFSKHSLLIANGKTSNSIDEVCVKALQQLSSNFYQMSIDISLNDSIVVEKWVLALTAEKISKESHVEISATIYPIEIPLEEYSIEDALCEWEEYQGQYSTSELISINSNTELEQYISSNDCNYPEIDFSKYTLLFVRGLEPSGDATPSFVSLQQYSICNFELHVYLSLNISHIISYWKVPVILRKMDDCDSIKLVVFKLFEK